MNLTQSHFLQMVEILFHYADRALKKCPDQGKIQVMEQHFQVRLSLSARLTRQPQMPSASAGLCTGDLGLAHVTAGIWLLSIL